jgi:hypothetical protein
VAEELRRLIPRLDLTVSSSTPKGLERARAELGLGARIAPFPLDLPWPVITTAAKLKPQVFACLETEIWPQLLWWLERRGASLMMLNGRLSPRSFPRYLKVKPLIGLTFAAIGLIITALAPSYDFFMYYFTLVITPMMLLCGVFFPVSQLPETMQHVAAALPLTHAVDLARPLMTGSVPPQAWLHVAVLAAYTLGGFYVALVLFRRRLSR